MSTRRIALADVADAGRRCAAMFYVITAVLLWFVVPPLWRRWARWSTMTPAERSFTIRFATFGAVLAVVCAVAMLYLPHKERILLVLPLFAVGATLAKWRHNSRERLRRQAQEESSFGRARRIN